jgi:hypothetical protein
MNRHLVLLLILCAPSSGWAQPPNSFSRREAEYYVAAYAHHYSVSVPLVRAIVG